MKTGIITLIGYRGCGKSTVGPLVAARLGWECVDSDDVIEAQAGRSISDIFAADGEAEFRRLEAQVLQQLTTRASLVIAAGGGAILAEENRSVLKAAGPVIWLEASVGTLAARIRGDQSSAARRPSLTGKSVEQEVEEVLAARHDLYAAAAGHRICVDEATPEEIAATVVALLPQESAS